MMHVFSRIYRLSRLATNLMFFLAVAVPATLVAQPKHEVRGVWLTTLLGLDWPAVKERNNPEAQKASLRAIIENIDRMNLNTVFFQVRSRGNAMYRSAYEPWAAELTGTLGKYPGWDPLAFAIEECHKRGIELHAWINVCKVWQGGNAPPLVNPGHVVRQHPDWVEPYKDEYWLDPGVPAARSYVAEVIADLVGNYELDGIHLDYVRYPELDFSDAGTYAQYGSGISRDEWHRQNINALVKLIYTKSTAIRPGLKVGSAPIGIYKSLPTARGWEGYVRLGQDSRRWLRDGYQDYVVPQIYWGLKNRGSRIDFQALVHDWKTNASGKHVYVGTAPYRPEIAPWLFEHIDVCRNEHADGEVFFRYEHIKNGTLFQGRYSSKALPAPMTWRDDTPPPAPVRVDMQSEPNGMLLSWQAPEQSSNDIARYVLYRADNGPVDINNAQCILKVLPASQTRYYDREGSSRSSYAITALDHMGNESQPGSAGVPVVAVTEPVDPGKAVRLRFTSLASPLDYNDNLVLIGYTLSKAGTVRLRLLDSDQEELYILLNEFRDAGTYVIGVERNRMPGDVVYCVMETAGNTYVRFMPGEE